MLLAYAQGEEQKREALAETPQFLDSTARKVVSIGQK
jgi:hypothetical protein